MTFHKGKKNNYTGVKIEQRNSLVFGEHPN